MSTSACRSRMLTGPAWPSAIFQAPCADFASATGVITAAVPHANTSVMEPSAQPLLHSLTLTRRSSTP